MEIQRTPDKFTKYKKFSVFEIPEHIELYAAHASGYGGNKGTSFGDLHPMIITNSDSDEESDDDSVEAFSKDSIRESNLDSFAVESYQIKRKGEDEN